MHSIYTDSQMCTYTYIWRHSGVNWSKYPGMQCVVPALGNDSRNVKEGMVEKKKNWRTSMDRYQQKEGRIKNDSTILRLIRKIKSLSFPPASSIPTLPCTSSSFNFQSQPYMNLKTVSPHYLPYLFPSACMTVCKGTHSPPLL